MKLLTRCAHSIEANHWANALRAAGIPCELRNTILAGALGEIPWSECAPQIWLLNDLDEARARMLLHELKQPIDGPSWSCTSCSEEIEPQFATCWSCGSNRVV